MRGLAADYTVTVEGAGYRIVDKVAGRDGSTFVTSIEVIRWSNNAVRTLSYPPVAASIGEAEGKGGPEVSPLMAADADSFVLPALASDHTQVLPGLDAAKAFDGFDVPSGLADRLFIGLEAQLAHYDGAWSLAQDHARAAVFDHDWLS
ncbi:hypothetical protein [Brevundimonas sp. Root1279]|uniref:hypothetical protein n=1 Tax=Brevundimonas sp. Root1279 TaxID=1736443 RepID=UPI0006FEFF81|nr:hypothetical protein [Brevundimonas sp. Root1279]KQW79813.1 hypothetical protein ASC65_14805 [Brevundimonas sp. Root1279]